MRRRHSDDEGADSPSNLPVDTAMGVSGRRTNRGVGASGGSVALQHPLLRKIVKVCCANTTNAACRHLHPHSLTAACPDTACRPKLVSGASSEVEVDGSGDVAGASSAVRTIAEGSMVSVATDGTPAASDGRRTRAQK